MTLQREHPPQTLLPGRAAEEISFAPVGFFFFLFRQATEEAAGPADAHMRVVPHSSRVYDGREPFGTSKNSAISVFAAASTFSNARTPGYHRAGKSATCSPGRRSPEILAQ